VRLGVGLATAVIFRMFLGTALTLLMLPGILRVALKGYKPEGEHAEGAATEAGGEPRRVTVA
jgi:hypothetical protein